MDLRSQLLPCLVWRRVPLIAMNLSADLPLLLGRLRDVNYIVLDIENTLVPYQSTDATVAAATTKVLRAAAATCPKASVYFLTNSRMQICASPCSGDQSVMSVSRARKPFVRSSRIPTKAMRSARTVVCGDQLLTDGLLAWRLRACFVYAPLKGCPRTAMATRHACGRGNAMSRILQAPWRERTGLAFQSNAPPRLPRVPARPRPVAEQPVLRAGAPGGIGRRAGLDH